MILQSFRMAFSSILSNKMRSFLTMLGIIIGVVAVVVLVSLVNGATNSVTSQIQGLGSDLLTVNITSKGSKQLTMGEVEKLADDYASIGATAPSSTQNATAKHGTKTYNATIQGTTASYEEIGGLSLLYGRFLKTPDNGDSTAVAVVGVEVAEELFGTRQIVGQSISVNGRSFLIIGVLDESTSAFGGSDSKIIIPFTLAQRIFKQNDVTSFYATARDSESVDAAETDLTTAMMRKFNQDEDAFSISNQAAILDTMDSIMSTMTLLLGGIAGISLLVGGIGIMNIMLVSVAERTREIGIRKAIGAGRRRILSQFLIESLVISVLGGIIGILVSWGILAIVSAIASMSFAMTGSVIALAVGFCMFVGVVFGLYPASKASKLQPIQALRMD